MGCLEKWIDGFAAFGGRMAKTLIDMTGSRLKEVNKPKQTSWKSFLRTLENIFVALIVYFLGIFTTFLVFLVETIV